MCVCVCVCAEKGGDDEAIRKENKRKGASLVPRHSLEESQGTRL